MNLQDFRKLEKELGHPPTAEEVREYQAKRRCQYSVPEFRQGCLATSGRTLLIPLN